MFNKKCLLCKIVSGTEPSEKVLEHGEFLVIKNKYPNAPIHVLVIDKKHREKSDTISGVYKNENYWDSFFEVIYLAILQLGLDETGYKLGSNGAGYNHFEHEHFHIMGGTKKEPGNPS